MLRMSISRRVRLALTFLAAVMTVTVTAAAFKSTEVFAQGGPVIRDIKVTGNKRIEPETVKSYLNFTAGQHYDPYKADESFKTLFGTGLFRDVRISLQGSTVIVAVTENPLINRVAFEGNTEVKTDTLSQKFSSSLAPSIPRLAFRLTYSAFSMCTGARVIMRRRLTRRSLSSTTIGSILFLKSAKVPRRKSSESTSSGTSRSPTRNCVA